MRRLFRRWMAPAHRGLLAGLVAPLLAGGVVSLAHADTSTGTGTVTAGVLSEVATPTFAFAATLSGSNQTASYSLPITVIDARGTGAGWNLTITSTTWTSGANTLSTTASTIIGVTSLCVTGVTCTNATNTVTYPLTVPAATVAPTAVKFFSASSSTGLGQFTVTPTVDVAIPANTQQGIYASVITLAAVSGP